MVCVMGSLLASSAVIDCGFEPWSDQIKDHEIGIRSFSATHAVLRSKGRDWFARSRDNVSEWGDMSIRGLLFQWANTIKIQLRGLVQTGLRHHLIEKSRHDIAEKLPSWCSTIITHSLQCFNYEKYKYIKFLTLFEIFCDFSVVKETDYDIVVL